MKTILKKKLVIIIIIGMMSSLCLSYLIQIKMIHNALYETSKEIFLQLKEILHKNEIEAQEIKEQFRRICIVRAQAASYIIQNSNIAVDDQEEMKKIAKLLEVDELHVFDEKGIIYAGSEPKYYGYSFNSGTQMRFFLPMLEDRSLELCQDVTPNTSEGKLMQYAAVWRKDGQGIIQVGIKPIRLWEKINKNELSYIFSNLPQKEGVTLYAADSVTHEILASTNERLIGKSLTDIGFNEKKSDKGEENLYGYKWKKDYCIYTKMDQILVGRICTKKALYSGVGKNILILFMCLALISILMVWVILRYLDRYIIRGIHNINNKLKIIADGNLYEFVDVDITPEFFQLSCYINAMVESILDTDEKMYSVINMVKFPIGIYEYSKGIGCVHHTIKIPEIMDLSDEEEKNVFSNFELFEEKLDEMRKKPFGRKEDNIFQWGNKYIKNEFSMRDNRVFGILMDVTNEVLEKKRIENERDVDFLTGIYNNRGFIARIGYLLCRPDILNQAAFIMIDTDNLKMINDAYGHEAGNRYLQGMAEILNLCTAPQQIAAHLSGDEFSVLIYGCEDREELRYYIEELEKKQNGFEVEFKEGLKLSVKFSIGVAFYPEDGKEYDTLFKCADKRMYENKRLRKKKESMIL